LPATDTSAPAANLTSDTIRISRTRLAQLETDRRVDAGRRRIIARALQAQGFTERQIANLTRVSAAQAHKDLR
jgi:hypothetical protein